MSAEESVATLYVFKGRFGLPSIDPKCLQLMFYLRLNPNDIVTIRAPEFCTTPKLPALKYKSKLTTDFPEICQIIQKLVKPVCDEEFDDEKRNRIKMYKNLNYNLLENRFILNFWGLKRNEKHLADLYARGVFWVLQEKFRENLLNYYEARVFKALNERSMEDCLKHGNASIDKYLEFVSFVLGKKPFIFGDTPSTYDAHLCGYLAPLLTFKFPNNRLQKIAKKYTNVVRYVQDFLYIYGDKRLDGQDSADEEEGEDPARNKLLLWYVLLCLGTVAIGSVIYIFSNHDGY